MDGHRKNSVDTEDPAKGNQASNDCPIACLPMMWKLLTENMREKLYQHLERNGLQVDEQKGCRKGTRVTKDQLLVDQTVQKKSWRRLTNYQWLGKIIRKLMLMVPHSWILKCLEMVGAAKTIISIISKAW